MQRSMQRSMQRRSIGSARAQTRPFVSIAHGAPPRRPMPAAAGSGTRQPSASFVGSCDLQFSLVKRPVHANLSRRAGSAVVCQAKPKSLGNFEVKQQQLAGLGMKLSVKVPAAVVQRCHNRVVENLTKLIGKVPGFPANKPLPLGLVMDRCGGPKKFATAVIEDILILTYKEVMEPFNNVMYPDSDVMLTNVLDMVEVLDVAQPLEYEVQFELLPTVKWKSPYKDIQITIQDTGNEETDAEAADDFIKQELKNKGFQRIVQGRGLEQGDLAVIDMAVRLPGSKQPIPGMSKELLAFDTEIDPLGLTPHLVGMLPTEGRQFEIRFPEDWKEEELRGQAAEVTVKLSELFQWVLPEFDEEFVKKHYPQYETPAAMRQAIINTTAMQRFQQRDQDITEAFLGELVKIVDVQVPDNMLNDLGTNEYQRNLFMAISQGELKVSEAEALMTEERVKGYLEANRGAVEELAKVQLGSQEIIDAEGLQVTDEALAAEMAVARREFEERRMEYDEERLREQASEALKGVALLNWVKANIKIDIRPFVAAPSS